MKILIIGGTGYIGSRLFLHLEANGDDVETVDLEWFGNYVNPKNRKVNFNSLSSQFLKEFDAIIFLAAYSSVKMCDNNFYESFKNNVLDFESFIKKINPSQKFIYASSSSVYCKTSSPATEKDVTQFSKNYDFQKRVIDEIVLNSHLNCACGLRFGTVNGGSSNFRDDIMMNCMVISAIKNKKILVRNPDIYRPILDIRDLCNAITGILKSDYSTGVYNLASFNAKAGELALRVSDQLGFPILEMPPDEGTYDFQISWEKFSRNFGILFVPDINSLISDIISYDKKNISGRDCYFS
jgi:nucleoside-diphosphate-sugar epimerase